MLANYSVDKVLCSLTTKHEPRLKGIIMDNRFENLLNALLYAMFQAFINDINVCGFGECSIKNAQAIYTEYAALCTLYGMDEDAQKKLAWYDEDVVSDIKDSFSIVHITACDKCTMSGSDTCMSCEHNADNK